MARYRWTLADTVLVTTFLVALFGAGLFVREVSRMEKMMNSQGMTMTGDGIQLHYLPPSEGP